jgi:hypothetical protein
MSSVMRILIFCILCLFAQDAQAQKAGEILILDVRGVDANTTRLINAIKPHYHGVITIKTGLPAVLNYDAIMMTGHPVADDVLDSIEQAKLIDFLKAGGRFYAQGDAFRTRADHDDDTTDNQFWDFIGDSTEEWASVGLHIDTVFGVKGSFMAGLKVVQPYDPSGIDFPALLIRRGMQGVLVGIGNLGASLAWTSSNPNIKAALLWPIATGYYEEFISKLICTYFGLCELDVQSTVADEMELKYLPISSEITLPHPGRIVMSDLLGRILQTQDVSTNRFRLPSHLTSGAYLISWSSGDHRASLVIQHR